MAAAPLRRRAPGRRPAPAPGRHGAPARPVRRAPAPSKGLVRPRGAAVLDRLLAGRLWIGLVFVLLVGIVFFNVDLLQMNRDIAVTAEKSESVKRENARLLGEVARLGSSERIQEVAAERGLVLPAPGEVRYLKAHPGQDAKDAVARLKAGSGQADDAGVPPASAEPGPSGATGTTPAPATTTPQATTTTPQTTSTTPQAATPQPATTPTTSTPQAAAPATTTTGTGQ
jgi:cell division protein FtsL